MEKLGYISFLSSVLILFLKLQECKKNKIFSCDLPFYIFNLVFLNMWFLFTPYNSLDRNINDDVYFTILSFEISLAIGFLLCRIFNKTQNNVPTYKIYINDKLAVYSFFIVCLFFSFYFFYDKGLYIFKENSEALRLTSRAGSGYVMTFITRGLTICALLICILRIYRKIDKLNYILLISIIVFIQLLTGFRSFAVVTIIILITGSSYLRQNFSLSIIMKIGTIFVAVFFGLTYMKLYQTLPNSSNVITELIQYFNHRVLMELPRATGIAIDYAKINGTQFGATYLMDIITLAPGRQTSLGDSLFIHAFGYTSNQFITPLTPSIVGETFINFSYYGLFLIGFIIPFAFYMIEKSILASTNAVNYAIKIVIAFVFCNTIMLGIGTSISSRLVPIIIMFLMLSFASFIFKRLK
jgi:oligosaccharide repeat unit polymerase